MLASWILGISFLLLAVAERLSPRAGRAPQRAARWFSHAALGALAFALGKLALGAGVIGVALWAGDQKIGLFNQIQLSPWFELAATIVALDFIIWGQHWAMHKVPLFWRFHRVHHSDQALDVTSAWRFHPGEIATSLVVKACAVTALGAPAQAVAVFEVLLVVSAMFNHAHIRLPVWLDRLLSVVIVTPDMHRVHHGQDGGLGHRNFGFFLNIWDKVFRKYDRKPALETDALALGTSEVRPGSAFGQLLLQPFEARPFVARRLGADQDK